MNNPSLNLISIPIVSCALLHRKGAKEQRGKGEARIKLARYVYLVYIYAVLYLLACDKGVNNNFSTSMPDNIKESNAIRKKIGLRCINPQWFYYGRQFNEEVWKDSKNGLPCKKIKYAGESKTILWEDDYYYSGKRYADLGEGSGVMSEEFLCAHFEYPTMRLYVDYVGPSEEISKMVHGFAYVEPSSTERPPPRRFDEVASVTQTILSKWNMSRL